MTTTPDRPDAPDKPEGAAAAPAEDKPVTPYSERVGKILCGRYRITDVIGAGGFGVVFRAINLAVGQPVAVKLMLGEHVSNKSQVARFEREAMSVSSLRAPNTIRVFDFGRDEEDNLFIVMELLAGRPLSSVLQSAGPLAPRRAVHIAVQVAKSLAEAHEAGIVHRDLKPDNIFLADLPGEEDYVKVLDFGIAKLVGDNAAAQHELTRQGAVIGTPTYMSPEQARGAPIDARSDLYSLGVVLYRMLAGRPPFEAPSLMALVWKHNQEAPPDIMQYSRPEDPIKPTLAALLALLLAKEPKERPISARAVISALLELPSTVQLQAPLGAEKRADPEAATVQILEAKTLDSGVREPGPGQRFPPAPADKTNDLTIAAAPPEMTVATAPRVVIDPALVERATNRLAQSVGPIAKVVARKAQQKARDARDLVRLMAEQLEPHERDAFMTALGFPPR